MGLRKDDDIERRKLALMRSAGTVTADTRTISGSERKNGRPKPSLPKMPWEDENGAADH